MQRNFEKRKLSIGICARAFGTPPRPADQQTGQEGTNNSVQRTSKTWLVNCGWVLAANLAADLAAWCRLIGL